MGIRPAVGSKLLAISTSRVTTVEGIPLELPFFRQAVTQPRSHQPLNFATFAKQGSAPFRRLTSTTPVKADITSWNLPSGGFAQFELRNKSRSGTQMEVLRNSFEALLPVVKDAIDAADFIAIDTELTGLGIEEAHRPEFLDTAEERYVKYRRAAQDFLVTQYGICTFTWDQKQSAYIARPFNFFVFPQTGSRNLGLDRHFTCQVESIEFLSRYNFDFNKWASQGVPFVNRTDEDRARRRIRRSAVQGDIPIDIGNKEFIDTTLATVADWLQNSSEKSTEVTAPTSYHRRLVHQEIRNKYNAALKTEGSSGKIKVSKMTDEEKLSDDREQQLEKELEQLVGFRKVIDLISASKKPVIGHNMYLDLCHTYQRFYRNLPEDIHDFKKGLKELFPRIYDTKHIALKNESIVNKLEQTALGDIFSRVKSPPFDFPVILEHSDFTGYEEGGNRFHEAGYDAYATGVIFSKMIGFITEIDGGAPISFDIPVLENVLNKVNILRTDMPHLNLTGEDETPEREHVFHLYDFPEETKSKDIYNEFQTFGNVGLNWLGDTACLVTLRELSSVPRVMEEFGPNADRSGKGRAPSFTYKLETYTDFFARHKEIKSKLETPRKKGRGFMATGTPSTNRQDAPTPGQDGLKRKVPMDESSSGAVKTENGTGMDFESENGTPTKRPRQG